MKVRNMMSERSGREVANQFIISGEESYFMNGEEQKQDVEYFQSYGSIIVKKAYGTKRKVYLDSYYWDYSRTTSKYRNQFLGETTKETQAKIDSGEYILTNLN